ncbi:MAG: helix-turn-helix transcriptional regulator [Clostridia bacterium]|nr:helix-turn-helix transcriptional regulator [Clostridia bacterium]
MLHYRAEEEFNNNEMVALKKICDYRDEEIHNHDFVEIVYVMEGSGRHLINGEEFSVKAGDLLFINYGCTHAFYVDDKLVAYNLMVRVDYFTKNMIKDNNLFYMLALTSFEKIQHELNDKSPLVFFDYHERDDIVNLFKNVEYELEHEELGKSIILDSYINLILCKVFRKIFVKNSTKDFLIPQDILDYINEHFNEKITLGDLSQRCFYNPAYFSRLFKKTFNMSFTDYIMDIRLKHCCELLKNSDYTIDKIIEECGFSDRNTFYERFRNKYGCTPSEYRN